jgi:dUTPase
VKFTLKHQLATFDTKKENNTGYHLTICKLTHRNGITFVDFGVTVTIPAGFVAFIATNSDTSIKHNMQLTGGISLVTNTIPTELKAAFIPITSMIVKPLQIGDTIASLIVVPAFKTKTKQEK